MSKDTTNSSQQHDDDPDRPGWCAVCGCAFPCPATLTRGEARWLEVLARSLAERHGLDTLLDDGHMPLLWVNVPQTVAVREMVHITGDNHYQWDGRLWPFSDPDGLAERIAAYIAQYPATHPQPERWRR